MSRVFARCDGNDAKPVLRPQCDRMFTIHLPIAQLQADGIATDSRNAITAARRPIPGYRRGALAMIASNAFCAASRTVMNSSFVALCSAGVADFAPGPSSP